MKHVSKVSLVVAVLAAISLMQTTFAGEVESKARAVLEEHKSAVVTVSLVVKQQISMMGQSQDNESKVEATGTVINADGLTVVALSATDSSELMKKMMSAYGDQMKIDSEVKDVQILREGKKEVQAKIVLRDNELDLAYILPTEKPAEPFAFVDFSDAAEVDLLDQVVALNRLGKVVNRVYSVSFERIEAIVEKPRKFYLPGNDPTNSNQGSPVFTVDGKILGIFVLRSIKDTGGGQSLFGGYDNISPIVLPAADVMEGAAQAPGFEAEAEKTE